MSGTDRLVVIDACGDTLERCAALHEWLCWVEVDDLAAEPVVQAGAEAAANLFDWLRRGEGRAADLWTPDGRIQLGRLLIVDADVRGDVEAVVMAGAAAIVDLPSYGPRSFAAQLARGLAASATNDGCTLAGVPQGHGRRVRLIEGQWVAYRRVGAAVLTDPLDRFAAGLTATTAQERTPVDPPGPAVDL